MSTPSAPSTRWLYILIGVFVTFLWSTSYILNVYAFREGLGPLTLAGLRYTVAVAALWVVATLLRRRRHPHPDTPPTKKPSLTLRHFLLLGVAGYVMAQGLQYVGQAYVTPTQTSLVLNIGNTLLVLLVDALWLRESQNRRALLGLFGVAAGALLFYYPWHLASANLLGILFILLSSVGYAVNLTATRYFLSTNRAAPHDLTLRPMLIGALFLLAAGLLVEGVPHLTPRALLLLLWLGCINGALAFYLWTWTQQRLRAFESAVLNNLMLVQITLLDVIFLARSLTALQIAALLLTSLSVFYVQQKKL